MNEIAARFAALFSGRENCHGRYIEKPSKKVDTVRKPTPDEFWETHLQGVGPYLGQVPIRQDNTCYFAAIDVDDDGVDHRALAGAIEMFELPLTVCRSKSGGAHLYLFMVEPVSAKIVQAKLKQFANALSLSKNHDDRPIEIFPKQTRLRADDVGNWINLPYYNGDETNRYAVLQSGEHLTLDQFLLRAEAMRVTGKQLENLHPKGGDPFPDGPPCLKALHQLGYPSGMRNQGLYNVGVHMKLAHPDDWKDRVGDYNATKMDPPLGASELQGLLQSLDRRDYVYKCGELPIQPHCVKAECKKQKFGIGGFQRARDAALFPELSKLTKIETDPPRWQMSVNDKVVEVTTEDLLSIQRFRKSALERAMVIIPQLKQPEWDDKIRELMTEVTVIEAPEDAGVLGQFKNLVRDFLETRKHSETREDILANRPYEEEGLVYFRSADLNTFLEKRRFKDYPPSQVFTVLRHVMGARSDKIKIKNVDVRVWTIPAQEQTAALEVARVKGKTF